LNRLNVLKQLEKEQFTRLNAQVPTTKVWQRIALISSSEAAGLQDFVQQLSSNNHGYHFVYELFNARVQGLHATTEIREQIAIIELRKQEFDCVVIVRGGGARLDLMGFDDYDLCVAIATCELPVLTGIGHDIDETLADKVAFYSLKTPTAAADYLVHRMYCYEVELMEKIEGIKQLIRQRIAAENNQLTLCKSHLTHQLQTRFKMAHQQLINLKEKMNLLDPSATLNRGFTLLTNEQGQLIQSVKDLAPNFSYRLHFKDGEQIIKIK
jgi:exodeoxyribonuclease VII large subunit